MRKRVLLRTRSFRNTLAFSPHLPNKFLSLLQQRWILVEKLNKPQNLLLSKQILKQLIRLKKCTKCGVCLKVCPVDAIILEPQLKIENACTRCGKCAESCVAAKYFDRNLLDFR